VVKNGMHLRKASLGVELFEPAAGDHWEVGNDNSGGGRKPGKSVLVFRKEGNGLVKDGVAARGEDVFFSKKGAKERVHFLGDRIPGGPDMELRLGFKQDMERELVDHGAVVDIQEMMFLDEPQHIFQIVIQRVDVEPDPELAVVVKGKEDPLALEHMLVKKRREESFPGIPDHQDRARNRGGLGIHVLEPFLVVQLVVGDLGMLGVEIRVEHLVHLDKELANRRAHGLGKIDPDHLEPRAPQDIGHPLDPPSFLRIEPARNPHPEIHFFFFLKDQEY